MHGRGKIKFISLKWKILEKLTTEVISLVKIHIFCNVWNAQYGCRRRAIWLRICFSIGTQPFCHSPSVSPECWITNSSGSLPCTTNSCIYPDCHLTAYASVTWLRPRLIQVPGLEQCVIRSHYLLVSNLSRNLQSFMIKSMILKKSAWPLGSQLRSHACLLRQGPYDSLRFPLTLSPVFHSPPTGGTLFLTLHPEMPSCSLSVVYPVVLWGESIPRLEDLCLPYGIHAIKQIPSLQI